MSAERRRSTLAARLPMELDGAVVLVEAVVVIALPVVCRDCTLKVPPQHKALVGEGQDESEHEKDHCKSASVAHLLVRDAGLEHGYRHRVRGTKRTASGHDPDHIKQLERSDHGEEDGDSQGWAEQRQGDVAERLPTTCPI